MKDSRDPQELYRRIQHEMRVHHCTIIEAADRVEGHMGLGSVTSGLTTPQPLRAFFGPLGYADPGPPENGSQS